MDKTITLKSSSPQMLPGGEEREGQGSRPNIPFDSLKGASKIGGILSKEELREYREQVELEYT